MARSALEEAVRSADLLARILEAAQPKTGLRHRSHAKTIMPARRAIEKLLANYFERQGAAVLDAIKPRIRSTLEMHPPPAIPVQEAGGEWVTINGHPVLIGGDAEDTKARVERAKKSAVHTGQKEQAIADRSEEVLSKGVGVPRTRDNSAFDLRNEDVGIEVKTFVNASRQRESITMSKAALGRKLAEQRADGIKAYTVVVDRRTGGMKGHATYYYKEGLGSFRLGSMTKTTLSGLKEIIKP